MSIDRRKKDVNWAPADQAGNLPTWERVNLAVLMDIRDELKLVTAELHCMNNVIQCSNFIAIPQILRRISRNTAKPKPAKKS